MRLRNRILLASVLLIAAPLLVLTFGIRREMENRSTAQYHARITTLMQIIEADLAARHQRLGRQLTTLKSDIANDNDFRLAAVDSQENLRSYLLDYAGIASDLMGLDMLQIQSATGRIISSGHFRNEFGRDEPLLPLLLATAPDGTALVKARRPSGTFLAMARVDSVRLGGQLFHLVAGYEVDSAFLSELSPDPQLAVSLLGVQPILTTDPELLPHFSQEDSSATAAASFLTSHTAGIAPRPSLLPRRDYLSLDLILPLAITSGARVDLATATLLISHPLAPLHALLRSLNLWLGLVLLASLAGTFILAFWTSRLISRPLDELARKTAALDLDRLDADFSSTRTDEVGSLSRFLGSMTERLRASVRRLRAAEHRATLGEVARQVNHDIRNGLIPLRNVFKHLAEVAEKEPGDMARVLQERRDSVEAGLNYLETLASNYARLSPNRSRQPCDLNQIVKEAMSDLPPQGEPGWVELDLGENLPPIMADPIGLRRILDNLVRNAQESLNKIPPARAWVGIRTRCGPERAGISDAVSRDSAVPAGTDSRQPAQATAPDQVHLLVADNGCGISPAEQKRVFEDFYTSKPDGSGLGLSNVRRLVADYEGTITLISEPGKGTVFRISFPAVAPGMPEDMA